MRSSRSSKFLKPKPIESRTRKKHKDYHLFAFFLFVFILLVGVYFYIIRGELAKKAWADFHNSTVALFFDTDDAGFAMNIGNYYFNGTIGGGEYNPDLAQKAYKKAVSINPKILWGHYQLSRIAFVKGDYERALEEIKKELEANPQNLRSLYVRGLVYGYRNKSGDLELAENDFRRFTYWAPSEWAGYNDLAWILFKEGKYAEAEMELGRAFENIQVADKNPWLLNALGVARLNLGNKSGAGEAFLNALAEAEKLTANEWRASYPGNNPLSAEDGLKKFLETLKENIWRAKGA